MKAKFETICPKCGKIHTGISIIKERKDSLTNKVTPYFDEMFDKEKGNSCKNCNYSQ